MSGLSVFAENEDLTIILQINNPTMTVNGVDKSIDDEGTTPVILNERTLLPVRAVVEEIGGTVGWNGDTKEVTLTYGADAITLTIDSTAAYLNGTLNTLDTAPTIINERTMLPIRFIAESFGFDVVWEQSEQLVTITKAAEVTAEPTVEPTTEPIIDPTTEPAETVADNDVQESKAVVIYFSGTGTTRSLAQTIAETAGIDIYEIIPEEPYTSEDLNYNNNDCRANKEMNDDTARPAISGSIENIDEYDTIFLGYPIWWGTCPKIINTFLDTYDLLGKTIMPFCTSASSGIATSVTEIKNNCSGDVKDGFRGTSSTTSGQIEEWFASNDYEVTK
jgi:flavodoxin